MESYVGVALQDRDGQAIGTLCILARHPIVDPKNAEQILRVFGARAAAEIERQRAERAMEQLNQELEIRVRDRTAQLAASEERLQTLFNKAADAVFLLGEAGFIDCNQAAVELFKYSKKTDLLALQPHQLSPERQPDGQLSSVKAQLIAQSVKAQLIAQEALQQNILEFEWIHQRANGENFWAEVTLTPIRYQNELICHCIVRDISTQKLLEREQTQLISVLEATPDFIGIANTRGEILWHNKRLRDLRKDLGNPGEHRLISDCHPDWVNEIILNEALPTAIRLGSWSGELALLDGQGNEIPVSQVIIAHKTDAGDVETFSTVMRDIRDRKAAEASLRISESKFRTLLSNLDGVVYRCLNDEAWTMVFMSDAITALSGYQASEFIDNSKRTYASIVHPDDITRVTDSVARGLELRESFTLEYRIIHQDNSVRWVTEKGKGIFGHDGELLCLEGVILDISDRKTAELALQESQEQFHRMTENVPGMIYRYIIHADGRQAFTYVSAQVREFFELEPDAVTQNADLIWERIHSDDVSRLQDEILSNTELLQPFNSEFRLSLPQRGLRWVQINSQVEQLDTGDIIWDGVLIDISERKQLEQEQRRLSTILEATPDWIVILNSLGAIVWCNQPLVELRPDLDVREHPHYSNYYSEWASQFIDEEGLQQAKLHGSWSGELELLDAEGDEIPVSMVLIAHKAPNGSIMNFSAIMRDLRERIAIEDSLRESDAKFRNLISNLDGVVYRCQNNAAWTMEFMSDAIATLSGYPASDFINDRNRTYASIIHPDDRELVARVIDCSLAHREPFSIEYRVIHRDGSVRWVTEKGKGVFTADGWPLYLEGVIFDTSDRKAAEKSLQLTKFAVDKTGLGIFWIRKDGLFFDINESACTNLGYSYDELKGLYVWDITPDFPSHGWASHWEEIRQKSFLRFEVEHQRKDGSVFPVEIVSNYLEYDGEGYLFAQVQDISDRKRSEQRILESKAFLQTVLDIIPLSVFWKDRESYYIGANQNFIRDAGLSHSQDLAGLTDFEMPWAETEAEGYRSDDREVIQSNSPKLGIIETQFRANGEQIWLETNKLPLHDLEGNVIGVLGTYQDISERRAAEAELQALSNRLSLALKSGDLGYWQWMIATNELYWDDRLYELHGISKDELDYSIFRDSIHPDDVDLFDELVKYAILETPYENALGQSLPYEVIYRAVCPAGVIHYLKAYGTVLRDRESEVTGMLGVTFNITHFKLVEEQLECSNQELKRANRMKDEFLATMSHELRTPLNAVLGMAEILQEKMLGDINPKQLNALNTIEKSGTHLLQLINDILDLSKISAGKTELFLNFTDVALLCHESLQLIQPQAQAKKLRILTNIESNLPPIAMDEQRIRQVLINLLSNAVKFTPDRGQITLHVESQTVPDPDRVCSPGILRITVSDTGIGIAPKDLDKLFQPFVQIDSALNRQYSGTGLGLALVKKIVELHNGQISVTSEVGIGSSFIVDLPWIAAPTAPPVNTATTPKNEDRPQVTSDQTILLVEDDPANVMTISGYLEAKGYRLVLARNGHEAIDLVQALQPRVILMDIQMPGMDGLEATQYIRQTLGLTNIPIIALTALAMDGDRKRCLEAGVTEYLSKPVKLRRLEALIKTYLS